MQMDVSRAQDERRESPVRKAWAAPAVTDMPPLKDLTLQTGLFSSNDSGKSGFTYG